MLSDQEICVPQYLPTVDHTVIIGSVRFKSFLSKYIAKMFPTLCNIA